MTGNMVESDGQTSSEPPTDDRLLLKWLESQPEVDHQELTKQKLEDFFEKAAQPRHASGNACIKLCYFIEQCRSSRSSFIRDVAFSEKTALDLFNFYIEWNEKNQNRSMRQVLELVSSLIAKNPDATAATAVKTSILCRNMAIIAHQAAHPLVKPAFKSLECLLSKGTISTAELIDAYEKTSLESISLGTEKDARENSWDNFFSGMFGWMILPDVSPAAGKFLVTVFRELRSHSVNSPNQPDHDIASWQRWIRKGLSKNPDALENFKNYLFPPLFKLDRPGSLAFLEDLNRQSLVWDMKGQEMDVHSLLRLAAIEMGKKAGLVEEPNTIQFQKPSKKSAPTIVLEEEQIGSLLYHASEIVRSLAFSVLVSSSSSIRPLGPVALEHLKAHMSILFSETDAKIRNEILSNTKHLIERLRGATAFLVRELENLSFQLRPDHRLPLEQQQKAEQLLSETQGLLCSHESFIEWYLEFLLGELIPTASYQRHITSLKAIYLLLRSGILKQNSVSPLPRASNNVTVWPYSLDFFTPGVVRLLLDLVMDPFEDVRGGATSILKLASACHFVIRAEELSEDALSTRSAEQAFGNNTQVTANLPGVANVSADCKSNDHSLKLLTVFIKHAEEASKRTGRADYADGVARSYELLYGLLPSADLRIELVSQLVDDLELKVGIAEGNLGQAVVEAPVHGNFAALNFVWDAVDYSDGSSDPTSPDEEEVRNRWDNLQNRMVSSCSRIWEAVKEVLCNDSPEGHLPVDLDEDDAFDTKDVLSYSFRAVHESSNLLRTLVNKQKIRFQNLAFISTPITELFEQIGNLTFNQLSHLRHRGAFSTVSLTFSRCCQVALLLQGDSPSTDSKLLHKWYRGAIACVLAQASTTRRSAGIPALITGILSANSRSPSFADVFSKLSSIARTPVEETEKDETNLPQVHALNSIKEIFKSAVLGNMARAHTSVSLNLAAEQMSNKTWAIRNSSLMLFSSIANNITGADEGFNGSATQLSWENYPGLAQLIFKLLTTKPHEIDEPVTESRPKIEGDVQSVYAALDFLRRAGPPENYKSRVLSQVMRNFDSKDWQLRETSARLFGALLHKREEWFSTVEQLLNSNSTSANESHSILLAVGFVLQYRLAVEVDRVKILDDIKRIAPLLSNSEFRGNACPIVEAAYWDIVNTLSAAIVTWPSSTIIPKAMIVLICGENSGEEFQKTKVKICRLNATIDITLLKVALIRKLTYATAINRDYLTLRDLLVFAQSLGPDIAIDALKCAVAAWSSRRGAEDIVGVCKAYTTILSPLRKPSEDLVALGFISIADTLDQRPQGCDSVLERLQGEFRVLDRPYRTPRAECAAIQLSGYVTLSHRLVMHEGNMDLKRDNVLSWGRLIRRAINPENDLDCRLAAAKSLRSFYSHSGDSSDTDLPYMKGDCFIGPTLALYDCLQDDDEDIRNIAGQIVSRMFKESLAPIEAQRRVLEAVADGCREEPLLIWNVVARLTGDQHASYADGVDTVQSSVPEPLHNVFKKDNALFAKEEPNIYYDVVKELGPWMKIFLKMPIECLQNCESQIGGSPIDVLREWVLKEYQTLRSTSHLEKPGPLDRMPKRAFAGYLRVLYCAFTVVAHFIRVAETIELTHFIRTTVTIEKFDSEEISQWKSEKGLHEIIELLEEFALKPPALGLHEPIYSLLLCADSLELTMLDVLSVQISAMSRHPERFLSLNNSHQKSAAAKF